eukprot:2394228-Prymnesium_polylepis.3
MSPRRGWRSAASTRATRRAAPCRWWPTFRATEPRVLCVWGVVLARLVCRQGVSVWVGEASRRRCGGAHREVGASGVGSCGPVWVWFGVV